MKHRKQQGNKRRYKKSKPSDDSPEAEGNNRNSMTDVMAQLRLQRQKEQSKVANAAAKCNINKSVQKQEIGDFRFDPITNRYLPKSSFHKSDQNATQKQVKNNVIIDRLRWKTRNSVTDEAVTRVIFRGSTISSSLEQKANSSQVIPCSERSIHLLLISRSYCRSSQRRDDIVNNIGPISIARGAKVIPAAVTEDILRTNARDRQSNNDQQHVPKKRFPQPHTNAAMAMKSSPLHNQIWYSLLRPIISSRKIILQPELSPSTPYDCMCRSYLPPTSTTFDIRSYPNALPSVVTLANEEIFCRQKEPIHSNGRRAFKTGDPHCTHSAWELPGSAIFDYAALRRKADRKYQSVRFARSTNHIGIVASDVNMNYHFAYKNIFRRNEPATHIFSDLEGPVNDFCFSPNDHTVAFAHTKQTHYGMNKSRISCLDMDAGRINQTVIQHDRAEMLCLQYLGKHLLCGHRDGSVCLHDDRLRNIGCHSNLSDLGSATNIQPLRNENAFVVKGSFGCCQIIDVRRLGVPLVDLRVPVSLVHETNSTRCTGVVVDPTETLVVSPFAGQRNVSFALWCTKTGRFLRSIDSGMTKCNGQLPLFCELSSTATSGFAIKQSRRGSTWRIERESEFGIWFKGGPMNPVTPTNYGSIHHLSFPK